MAILGLIAFFAVILGLSSLWIYSAMAIIRRFGKASWAIMPIYIALAFTVSVLISAVIF